MTIEPNITVFRPERPGIRKVLGDLEAEIMEIIWARPSDRATTVRDVFEVLHARRRIAYTSVMSTMTRLAKKKLLRAEKRDQAYLYYPNFTQDEFIRRFVGHILENLLVGFAEATLNGLAALPDQHAAAQARRLIDEAVRRRVVEEGE